MARVEVIRLDDVPRPHLAAVRPVLERAQEVLGAPEVGLLGPTQVHEGLLEEAVRLDAVHRRLEAGEELDAVPQHHRLLRPVRHRVLRQPPVRRLQAHAVAPLLLLLLQGRLVVVDTVVLLIPHQSTQPFPGATGKGGDQQCASRRGGHRRNNQGCPPIHVVALFFVWKCRPRNTLSGGPASQGTSGDRRRADDRRGARRRRDPRARPPLGRRRRAPSDPRRLLRPGPWCITPPPPCAGSLQLCASSRPPPPTPPPSSRPAARPSSASSPARAARRDDDKRFATRLYS